LVSKAQSKPSAKPIRKPKSRIGSENYLGLDLFEALFKLNAPKLTDITIPM
jgi:hypothetical protein